MEDKITISITRRKFTEILMGLVAVFFASGSIAAIVKYLWPVSANKGVQGEVMIASVDEVPAGREADHAPYRFHRHPLQPERLFCGRDLQLLDPGRHGRTDC